LHCTFVFLARVCAIANDRIFPVRQTALTIASSVLACVR
jgi:hypothetical protein